MKIKAAVTHRAGAPYQIEEVELAAPKAHELLVKITACGVCHTDAAVQNQFIPVPLPAVLGHEGSGVVVEVGPDVTEFQVGDRVGLTFGSCGKCYNCMTGHPHACEQLNAINFGGVQPDGTTRLSTLDGQPISTFFAQSSFATHAIVNVSNAVKVTDDDIDLALIGPLGCGIQTGAGAVLNRLRPEFGSSIAVFGCGTVGMSAIMAAKITGCEKIIAVGGNPKSLELAKELGATHTINRKEVDDIVGKIRNEITNGGVNYAIDTSGVPDFVKKALAACRFMGTCVVLGATGDVTFNIQAELMGDAKSLIGVLEGDSIPKVFIPKLLDYYKKGMFPFDKLIKFYPFEQINEAFAESGEGKCIKAVLRMD
ncbi:NAD(P)-dependent alcohol dehydrogenase [Intestinibacillus sp. Marseille-P6563]|uniref:NAD(P)-dependent alcohol dehydrogenase n=1 Tax=Intestinibacillus sp. Marseille-P6563 TaxID=2364792 RepID=UPI000F052C71|nr:NAD(P)-dependent alcohol dehydrogenase [Intestinibacillus sp. Marseille-P6563]